MMKRITFKIRALVTGIAATAMLLTGFVGTAAADHLPYVAAYSECRPAHVVTRPPVISPLPRTTWNAGDNVQVVGFRPHLARYYPGYGWSTIQSGIWKKTLANPNAYGVPGGWVTENGTAVDGSHEFAIPQVGTYNAKIYYATFNEYRWYGDATHASASTSDWNPHHEWRGSYRNQKVYEWCEYPGPNETVIR